MVATPIISENSTLDKGTGCTDKQAVITIEVPGNGARTVEAQHYLRSDDGTVSIYLGGRSDGIDIQVHVSRCVINRVDTHNDDVNAFHEFDGVDHVEYNGERYRLFDVADSDTLVLDKVHKDIIDAPADECVPVDDGNTTDNDQELVTDGGRPRKVVVYCDYCTAGMSVKTDAEEPEYGWKCKQCWRAEQAGASEQKTFDIIGDADVEPGDRVEYDGQEWVFVHYCMDHHTTLVPVGLVARDETVERPVDVRELDPVENISDDAYNHYDPVSDGHADDEPRLVTDGGTRIEFGDVVSHDGEQYRVGRTVETFVELYRPGETPVVERLSDVEIVPGAVAVRGGDR